mmetsp:Transcript_37662/g.74118  ORF Transcript_37662/g.74118 Transcript_37662/m.74118 type:complete len:415 (+) Transcript_37662:17-1261(+)
MKLKIVVLSSLSLSSAAKVFKVTAEFSVPTFTTWQASKAVHDTAFIEGVCSVSGATAYTQCKSTASSITLQQSGSSNAMVSFLLDPTGVGNLAVPSTLQAARFPGVLSSAVIATPTSLSSSVSVSPSFSPSAAPSAALSTPTTAAAAAAATDSYAASGGEETTGSNAANGGEGNPDASSTQFLPPLPPPTPPAPPLPTDCSWQPADTYGACSAFTSLCTHANYTNWTVANCPRTCCSHCKTAVDKANCKGYYIYCKDPRYSGWMAENCQKTCCAFMPFTQVSVQARCFSKTADVKAACASPAWDTYCTAPKWQAWMSANCQRSCCERCAEAKDLHRDCSRYLSYCFSRNEQYVAWMQNNCLQTCCNLVESSACYGKVDKDPDICSNKEYAVYCKDPAWKGWMESTCPKLCCVER